MLKSSKQYYSIFFSIIVLIFLFTAGCEEKEEPTKTEITEETAPYPSLPEEFTFIPDDGLRMEYASNPGAKVNEDDSVSLLYQDPRLGGHQFIAISADGLAFEEIGEEVTWREAATFRAKQLPDEMWRNYGLDTTKGIQGSCLISESSTDGAIFTDDEGCRYTLQNEDKGTMGVYDFFNDKEGGVVLLYIGDMKGFNNVRRAYSTDNGWTFTFTNGNVLGDEKLGGGGNSYVDEKVFVLPDDRIFLVAMKMGTIYGFVSDDNAVSFQRYEEPLLEPSDFDALGYGTVRSLHDPQIVQLQDGRYRIYVAALFPGDEGEEEDWSIVSATTG